jgi:hypothetical protein
VQGVRGVPTCAHLCVWGPVTWALSPRHNLKTATVWLPLSSWTLPGVGVMAGAPPPMADFPGPAAAAAAAAAAGHAVRPARKRRVINQVPVAAGIAAIVAPEDHRRACKRLKEQSAPLHNARTCLVSRSPGPVLSPSSPVSVPGRVHGLSLQLNSERDALPQAVLVCRHHLGGFLMCVCAL